MSVGRADCDVTLNDHEVSRRHVVLRPSGSELGIEDLGSTNGTIVDGQRIAEPVNVAEGAVVKVGTSEFIVQVTAPAPASQQTALSPTPVAVAPAASVPAGGLPRGFWTVTTLVEIALIATAAVFLVYYAV